jgi:hypothetical protein
MVPERRTEEWRSLDLFFATELKRRKTEDLFRSLVSFFFSSSHPPCKRKEEEEEKEKMSCWRRMKDYMGWWHWRISVRCMDLLSSFANKCFTPTLLFTLSLPLYSNNSISSNYQRHPLHFHQPPLPLLRLPPPPPPLLLLLLLSLPLLLLLQQTKRSWQQGGRRRQ